MKTSIFLTLLATTPLCLQGQGKVNLINDSASLIVLPTDTSRLKPADVGLAGQPVGNAMALPSGVTLVAGLYGGTSSSSLFLYSTVSLNNAGWPAGYIPATHIVLSANSATGAPAIPGIASGTAIGASTPWFQVKVWDSSYATYEAAMAAGGSYMGSGPLFQMNPGWSIAYVSTAPAGPNSTWTDAPFILGGGWQPCYCISILWSPRNQTVVQGNSALFDVGVSSTFPLSYQWYFNGAPIAGANAQTYVISSVLSTNAGTYSVVVMNGYRSVFGGAATLTVLVPPRLTAPPVSQTAEAGSTVGFSVGAAGDRPLTYQWFFNGANPVTGATTNSGMQLAAVGADQAGAYTVVVTNIAGAMTSTPAMLAVIPPVPRRMVPGITRMGPAGTSVNIEVIPAVGPQPSWAALDSVVLTNPSQWYFDLTTPLPVQRFYRTRESSGLGLPLALDLHLIPALTLTGAPGGSVRVDSINQIGFTDAWTTLETVTLTNSSQLYFDTSVIGCPPRLWRIVPLP